MFNLPSPLQKISSPLFSKHKVEVYVKRDDLIHPFVSGNKLRKLKGWFEEASQKKIETLVSFGGAYSNHLIALAFAASAKGFKSIGIVRGDEASDNLVLKHCRLFGMEIRYVDRETYRNKEQCFQTLFGSDESYLYIPEGGAGNQGMKGFADFLQEPEMDADYYIVAAGTGTTAKGIAQHLTSNTSKVIAMTCVKDPSLNSLAANNLEFNFDYVGKGFGKFDTNAAQNAQSILKETQIFFDPVYTLKAWTGFLDLVSKDFFAPNSKIIFVHTGGLTGWWGI
jgi:1-aminocyclopropane-1-carboxylate deaminase